MRPPCPPLSPCWCEENPQHPKCVPILPIFDTFFVSVVFILGIYVVFKNINKSKLK